MRKETLGDDDDNGNVDEGWNYWKFLCSHDLKMKLKSKLC